MSILIPTGQSRTGVVLPGAQVADVRTRVRPLAVGAVVTYLACTSVSVAAALAADGDVDRVERLWQLSCTAVAVALAITAVWSHRVASAARTCGVPNVRPGRIALLWLLPVVGPPAAIRHLGRLVREFDYSERRLGFWMFGLYAHALSLLGTAVVVVSRAEGPDGLPVIAAVQRQTSVLWLQAAMSAVLTVLAARAVVHTDRALSARSRPRRR